MNKVLTRRRKRPSINPDFKGSSIHGRPPSVLMEDLTFFQRNWSYISFQFSFKSFYMFPRPFGFETSKNKQIHFIWNTYKIRHYKKDHGNPT
ncbi:hypothetical protein EJ110_NYTH37236 [Nymphaea thermarum]|nr:hypothetical protein EJ110_NYTH37236 [Nymphaea thermarum]